MMTMRQLGLVSVLSLISFCRYAAAADVTVLEVTWETCAEGTAAVLKGEACHIQDIAKGSSRWELTMKFGLFVEYTAAAGAGAGAGASSAFVVKLAIPGSKAKSEDEVRKYLREHPEELAQKFAAALKARTPKAPSEEQLLRILRRPTAPYCTTADAEFEALLRKNSCSLAD